MRPATSENDMLTIEQMREGEKAAMRSMMRHIIRYDYGRDPRRGGPGTAMVYRLNRRLCVAENGGERRYAEFDTQAECAAWAAERGLDITRGAGIKSTNQVLRGADDAPLQLYSFYKDANR